MSSLLHPAPAGQRKLGGDGRPLPPVQLTAEDMLLRFEPDADRRWAMDFAHHVNAHNGGKVRARSAKKITVAEALVTLAALRKMGQEGGVA